LHEGGLAWLRVVEVEYGYAVGIGSWKKYRLPSQ
jgi:hypothetical protein